MARGKSSQFEKLKNHSVRSPPSSKLHASKLELVKEYFLVGGMPAAVSSFRQTLSLEESSKFHEILLSTYAADFSTYASPTGQKYLKSLFQGIFPSISQHFKYSKIDPNIRARELKLALDHLQWAGLIHLIQSLTFCWMS